MINNEYNTHAPVLFSAIKYLQTKKDSINIVEMGCGQGSTPLLRSLIRDTDRLWSLESKPDWFDVVSKSFESMNNHSIQLMDLTNTSNLKNIADNIDSIDLLFCDSSPWESRTLGLDILGPKSTICLVHDVDYYPHNGIWGTEKNQIIAKFAVGERDYSDRFRYWAEVFPETFYADTGPPTLIGSQTDSAIISLSYKDCFIVNYSRA